jgi:hypothetical protein
MVVAPSLPLSSSSREHRWGNSTVEVDIIFELTSPIVFDLGLVVEREKKSGREKNRGERKDKIKEKGKKEKKNKKEEKKKKNNDVVELNYFLLF